MVDLAASVWRDFVTDGVPASGANKPQKSKIRTWGAWLESRQTGTGLLYNFSSTTADADPGAGTFRLNNAAALSATALYIDDLDATGANVGGVISIWDDSTSAVKGLLAIRGVTNPSILLVYSVTGTVVDGGGYRKLTLTYAGGSGTPATGDEFVLTFDRSGDQGAVASVAGLTGAIAAPDLRLAETVPVYVTLAGLPGLDTAKDTVAICTDNSYEDLFFWKAGDQSARTVVQSVTSTVVNSGTGVVTANGHLLSTGTGVVVTTAVDGLSLNTAYYAIKVDDNNIKLATTPENALAGTAVTLTGTTNFTMKQLVDPLQDVYVIKTGGQLDGTAGTWVRVRGSRSLGIGRNRIHRLNDVLYVGLGATSLMKDHSGTLSTTALGSWTYDEQAPGSAFNMGYLTSAAIVSAPAPIAGFPNAGVAGLVRTPDGATNSQNWGITGFASGHGTSGTSIVWGGYFEAVKRPTSNSTAQGVEIEVTNLNSTPISPVLSSEATYVQGRTFGIFLASGGSNTTPSDADGALFIGNNGAAFRTGITFFKNSLTKDATTNYQHAIILPNKARIEWDTSDGLANDGYTIHSEVSDSAHGVQQVAKDSGLQLMNVAGKITWNFAYVASAVNYISYSPAAAGAGPNFQVIGDDTNVDFSLIARGTGGIRLRDGSAVNKFVINSTGIGFFNTTPAAQGAIALPTGTIQRTTYATSTVTLAQLAGVVMAIITDMRAYGLSG